jgi:hypothetical protein
MSECATIALDAGRRTALNRWIDTCDNAVTLHPTGDDDPYSGEYYKILHSIRTRGLVSPTNISPPLIFEFNYRDGEYQFRCLSDDEHIKDAETGTISCFHHSFDQQPVPSTLVDAQPGQRLAGCSFVFNPERSWPLPATVNSRVPVPQYRSLVPPTAHNGDSELLVQVVARPAMRDFDWLRDRVTSDRALGRLRRVLSNNPLPPVPRDYYHQFQNDRYRRNYHVNVRILGLAQSPKRASTLVDAAATRFSTRFGQGILIPERVAGDDLDQLLEHAATRAWIDRSVRLTDTELGYVCPLPTEAAAPWIVRLSRADPLDTLSQRLSLAADPKD